MSEQDVVVLAAKIDLSLANVLESIETLEYFVKQQEDTIQRDTDVKLINEALFKLWPIRTDNPKHKRTDHG